MIAAVASGDALFTYELAALLVASAPPTAQKHELGRVPEILECRAEETLYAVGGTSYGRVDLRFENADVDFTLLAELKLFADYGPEQTQRYLDALRDLPPGGRRGLIAVTRNVPSAGEPAAGTPRWLGSIRWTDILDGLRKLPVDDERLGRQWRLLLTVIEDQGDFGMKQLDRSDVEGWARYLKTRGQLEVLIDDLAPLALEHLRAELAARDAWAGHAPKDTAQLFTHGKQLKVPYPTQSTVHARFLIPARQPQERLRIQFLGGYTRPLFTVEARRAGSAALLAGQADGHQKFIAAANTLRKDPDHKFDSDRRLYWARVHGPERWLERDDVSVGEALLDIIKKDITALAKSGILDPDAGFNADVGIELPEEPALDQ